MQPIISANGLSKRYLLMRSRGRSEWITAGVARGAASVVKRILMPWRKSGPKPELTELWSLADVTFDVNAGEVIGLVGHNGAGKTTLLRVLSGITEPTRGRAVIRGRLNSLLEVGIGFHPELTGRENIYMKAAIHGMRKDLVVKHVDEIVAFAEVDDFLDTPLKRYSAGMRSRLGLAIGMVLEHEVMVVDEALAVGDARFRARASDRIRKSATSGMTTVFVSHDLGQIRDLCARSLLMDRGRLVADGPTAEVLDTYLRVSVATGGAAERDFRIGETRHLRRLRMIGPAGPSARFDPGQPFAVEIAVDGVRGAVDLEARIIIANAQGQPLFRFRSAMTGLDLGARDAAELVVRADIAELPLTPGHYTLGLELGRGRGLLERVEHALRFEVLEGDPYGHGEAFVGHDGGIWVKGRWTIVSEGGVSEGGVSEGGVSKGGVSKGGVAAAIASVPDVT